MHRTLLTLATGMALIVTTGTAFGQLVPGSIGNGGRMPDTMSPGAMAPPAPQPNTYSLNRDRLEGQGYKVQRLEQNNDGSWRARVSRDAVPTRPQGVPKRVTIHPNGQVIEEY